VVGGGGGEDPIGKGKQCGIKKKEAKVGLSLVVNSPFAGPVERRSDPEIRGYLQPKISGRVTQLSRA
jgi:hypothetical protein